MFEGTTVQWQSSRRAPAWALAVGMALFAALLQASFIPIDGDISWLITVSERVLDGQRLYVDVIEVNPPASVWLYLPWVALARLCGLRPEGVIVGATLVGALLSLRATLRLTARLPQASNPVAVAAAVGFVTLLLPGGLFAQREHVALLLAIPTIAAIVLLGHRGRLPRRTALLAGLGAGLIIAIKPHFALALLLPALGASRKLRSPAPLLVPALVAAAVVALYALAVVLFEPAFLTLLPMLAATYLPMGPPWWHYFASSLLIVPAALVAAAVLLRARPGNGLAAGWLLGGVGFALAGLLQWKNYANHAFPGVALCLAGVVLLLLSGAGDPRRRRTIGIGVAALALALVSQTVSIRPDPTLAVAIARVAPPHPTMMTLGSDLVTGHPVVRNIGGRWVGRRAALFTAAGALYVGLDKPGIRHWYDEDLAQWVADVRAHRPEVMLVEDSNRGWLLKEPQVRAAMRDYRPAARAGEIEVWRRR
ncbi:MULTISPECIES: hypothetical protein [Sphingomonas]|uniref:hypothetical protein n=1 Tax=Sphingomonas TaxID=13687 RepID=UPI0013B4482E|nr:MULTISPECIES: hypothetical protein [Sphingomonas]